MNVCIYFWIFFERSTFVRPFLAFLVFYNCFLSSSILARVSGSVWIEGAVGCGAGTGGAGTSTVWGVPSVFTMSIIRFESIGDWAKDFLTYLVRRFAKNLTIGFNFFANRRPKAQGHLWFFGQERCCFRYFIFQGHCACFWNTINIHFSWSRVLKIQFRPFQISWAHFEWLLQSMWIINQVHFTVQVHYWCNIIQIIRKNLLNV